MSDWNEAIEAAAKKAEIGLLEESGSNYGMMSDSERARVRGGNAVLRLLADSIRSLKRPVDQDGWMPIESAPKDGTPFLVYWLRRYSDGERYEAVQPQCVCHFTGSRLFPSWIEENKDYPTHWRPLPSAPTPEAE